MKLDFNRLRILTEVYSAGSVSAVANAMDMSQSTISYTIQQLRAELGDPLFVKVGRNVEPTNFFVGAHAGLVEDPRRYGSAPEADLF